MDWLRQQPVDQIKCGNRQERAEHVRVLEGTLGTIVEREVFSARYRAEIAEDAEQGR
ncbi:hypothetical protein D9M69_657410 [compost metagenome]